MATQETSTPITRRRVMWGITGVIALLLAGYLVAPDAFRRAVGIDDASAVQSDASIASQVPNAGGRGLIGILRDIAERTPGIRIGGTALKGKLRFADNGRAPTQNGRPGPVRRPIAEVASIAPPASALPGEVGPAVPQAGPAIVLPDFAPVAQIPGVPGGGGSFPLPFPGVGVPGGGFPPGGGGVIVIPPVAPPTNPPVVPPINPPPPPPVPGIPEPSVWFMLILGFGFIGSTMRQTRRIAFN